MASKSPTKRSKRVPISENLQPIDSDDDYRSVSSGETFKPSPAYKMTLSKRATPSMRRSLSQLGAPSLLVLRKEQDALEKMDFNYGGPAVEERSTLPPLNERSTIVEAPHTPKSSRSTSEANRTPMSMRARSPIRKPMSATPKTAPAHKKEACVKTMPVDEYVEWMETTVTKVFGSWDELEGTSEVRGGNNALEKKHVPESCHGMMDTMTQAQYGRSRTPFVEQSIRATQLSDKDRFFDIGSGIGTVVLHVAATVGCASSGVELINGRHNIGYRLMNLYKDTFTNRPLVELFNDSFTSAKPFKLARESTVLFVNNAESVFSSRSVATGALTLDYHVARLACGMVLGARILCFEALTELDAFPISMCFYRQDHESVGGATSWTIQSNKSTNFFVYTKLNHEWVCGRCTFSNTLLRSVDGEDKERIQDFCAMCNEDPHGMTRAGYTLRAR